MSPATFWKVPSLITKQSMPPRYAPPEPPGPSYPNESVPGPSLVMTVPAQPELPRMLAKVSVVPAWATSKVAVLPALIVNRRSVLAAAPV